jgi:hypothetical protein
MIKPRYQLHITAHDKKAFIRWQEDGQIAVYPYELWKDRKDWKGTSLEDQQTELEAYLRTYPHVTYSFRDAEDLDCEMMHFTPEERREVHLAKTKLLEIEADRYTSNPKRPALKVNRSQFGYPQLTRDEKREIAAKMKAEGKAPKWVDNGQQAKRALEAIRSGMGETHAT